MSRSTQAIDAFRDHYQLRRPRNTRLGFNQLEHKELVVADGIRFLAPAPAEGISIGTPPTSRSNPGRHRYLWVIDSRGIPYIIEAKISSIGSKLPKHTNLTGGKGAYLGGEMWFSTNESMHISGGSGRYPPVDNHQLEAARQVFESFGYLAISLGWDYGMGYAKRYSEES